MHENNPARRPRAVAGLLAGACVAMASLAMAGQAQALTIELDYTLDGGFFSGQNASRRIVMEAAANAYERHITDSLGAITSAGGNQYTINFRNPATREREAINNYSVAADTMVVYVGGSQNITSLGVGGPGGFGASAVSQAFIDSLNRGQVGDTRGSNAVEIAPWGGSISFNDSTTNWYFDPDPSTREALPGQTDFLSVALHEMGHVFGLGTSPSWDAQVENGVFTGEASRALFGEDVPLDEDLSHWQTGLMSVGTDGVMQEVLMDPTLTVGTRSLLTELDLAGFESIGWEVTAVVPLPAAGVLFASALVVMGLRRRKAHAAS